VTVRPSRFHHPQILYARDAGWSPRADPLYAAASRPAANTVSCRSNAQAIRTSLLASATTTVFPCARLSRPRSQLPSGVAVLDSPGRAARAPWMMSLRIYLLPRLVIPSSFGLPPVVA
jgi:hypothetical protein